MEGQEPAAAPTAVFEEQPSAKVGNATFAAETDPALLQAVGAMATAVAGLIEPSEATALNEAAAALMKGE